MWTLYSYADSNGMCMLLGNRPHELNVWVLQAAYFSYRQQYGIVVKPGKSQIMSKFVSEHNHVHFMLFNV